jgi:CheY-like chemotaxis protein
MTAPQLSVLIVEDDLDTRELTAEVFRAQQFNVLLAESVAAATRILDHLKPAMVLLDLTMPDGDGINLLRRIKQNESLAKIPVLLVTGVAQDALPPDASLALAVFRKPFDVPRLAQVVQTFCAKMSALSQQ